ncbi:hypothetical protein HMI56_002512 [Coelomomyces lativittatus]|nr:hypothetical protein HMI56_002512 [Coelomomyces lativittatus]
MTEDIKNRDRKWSEKNNESFQSVEVENTSSEKLLKNEKEQLWGRSSNSEKYLYHCHMSFSERFETSSIISLKDRLV